MIGYYAHSHGSGHCNFANIFGKIFGHSLTIFTERVFNFNTDATVIQLASENPDGTEFDRNRFLEPRALHYAPVNITNITSRNQRLLTEVLQKNIRLLIVDVSVEIAMLARVSSIPYAYVRLPGNRDDVGHLNAYEGASFLLAYFDEALESVDTPNWVRRKTIYIGFLSRYMFDDKTHQVYEVNATESSADTNVIRSNEQPSQKKPLLLHISGFGGSKSLDFRGLENKYRLFSIGPATSTRSSPITHLGVVKSTKPYIAQADIIVAACGLNAVSEILSLGKRFIAIPEKRPYEEQQTMAKNLATQGWAVNYAACKNIKEAVGTFCKLDDSPLPIWNTQTIVAFKNSLEAAKYRVDQFLVDRILQKRQKFATQIS